MHAVHTAAALLNTLTHLSPDSALLLLTFAVLLIYVELNRPGWILPGALGLLLLSLAVASLLRLDLSWPAALLVVSAVALLTLGLIRRVHALIPAAATLALILGFARLMHGPGDARVHVVTASVCGLSLGVVTSVLTVIARRARTNKRVRLS
jgi:membrane-bound serine protease (ClpP class)